MAPEHRSGEQNKTKTNKNTHTHHASWFPVFSIFLVNAAFLFKLAQNQVKPQKGTSLSTRATTTHRRPVQHQPHQHIKCSVGQEIKSSTHVHNVFTFSKNTSTLKVKMELLQKLCCYCVQLGKQGITGTRNRHGFLIKGQIILTFLFQPNTKLRSRCVWKSDQLL